MRALFVVETVARVDKRIRRHQFAGDRLDDLTAQRDAPLLGDITAFVIAELTNDLFEARAVELAGEAAEIGVGRDPFCDLVVRQPKPQTADIVVECRLGQKLRRESAGRDRARAPGRT